MMEEGGDAEEPGKEEVDEEEEEASERKSKAKEPRGLTLEEILFTPEELKERNQRRLQMSGCCMDEAWDLYGKLTDPLDVMKSLQLKHDTENSEIQDNERVQTEEGQDVTNGNMRTDNCVIDAVVQRRLIGLEKKYALFHLTLLHLKEAPSPPFIRIASPTVLDEEGRRHHLVSVTRTQRPELDVVDIHPKTIATTDETTAISNANFFLPDDYELADIVCQTDEESIVPGITRTNVDTNDEDRAEEAFELTDYPLDDQGNPIGKTTGFCQYCGQEILPIPTPYQQDKCFNQSRFYCCNEYRQMFNEADALENKLRAELARQLIDIRPHAAYDPKKSTFPGFGKKKMVKQRKAAGGDVKKLERGIDDKKVLVDQGTQAKPKGNKAKQDVGDQKSTKDVGDKKAKDSHDKKAKPDTGDKKAKPDAGDKKAKPDAGDKKAKPDAGDTMKAKQQDGAKNRTEASKSQDKDDRIIENEKTDTKDLLWDPYEAVFKHPRYFTSTPQDPQDQCYQYVEIVLTQTELYDDDDDDDD